MIFYDRDTVNYALELNDTIDFKVIKINDDISYIKTSEVFKNYEHFLSLYCSFPVLPSSKRNNNNPFMVQSFPKIVEDAFLEITKRFVKRTLPKLEISHQNALRGNVGQYSRLESTISSIIPHIDGDSNYLMVCNYWVNVNRGDGTQIWKNDKITNTEDISNFLKSNYNITDLKMWYNIEKVDGFEKLHFIEAENNTCIFYFSNILHSPVINEDDHLRCSIVSRYDLKESDESKNYKD